MQIGIIKIKNLITSLINYVKQDYAAKVAASRESESFLYRVMKENEDEEFDFFELSKQLILRDTTDSRNLEVRLMFDKDRAQLPTIHVMEPGQVKGKVDGIGNIDDFFYQNTDNLQHAKRRSFESNFELMITSSNQYEVIVIKDLLIALLIGAEDSLNGVDSNDNFEYPFYNFSFASKELMANNDLIPYPLFIKAISIHTTYDIVVPNITSESFLRNIVFQPNILRDE